MKKFLIVFVIILLAIGGYYAWLKFSPNKFTDGYYLIPQDAFMVIESEDPINTWETFSTSNLWQGLKSFPAFAEITKNADKLDDIVTENQQIFSVIGQKHLLISMHMTKKKDFDFVFYTDIEEASKSGLLSNGLVNLVSSFNYNHTVRKFKEVEINEFFDTKTRETLSIALINNYLVCSYNKALVDQVITASGSQENQLGAHERFTETNQLTTANGICRILINYETFHQFLGVYMEDVSMLKDLFSGLYFSGFDCTLKDDVLLADGYSLLNDSVSSYLQALSISGKSENNSAKIFSQKASFYLGLGFNDFNKFYENLKVIWKKDEVSYNEKMAGILKVEKLLNIKLQKNIFDWIGSEIGLAQYETDILIGNKVNSIMAIKAKNIEDAKVNLEYIEKQVRKRTPLKFKDVIYNGYVIKYLEVKGLFKSFLGNMFSKFDKPYYTILGDYVVMSDDPRTLLMTIDDYIKQNTLSNNESYRDFRAKFPNETNVFVYLSPDRHFANFKGYLNAESWTSTQKNKQYVCSFSDLGFSLSGENDRMRTVFNSLYKPYVTPLEVIVDTSDDNETDTLTLMDLFVVNHFQNNLNTTYYENGLPKTVVEMDDKVVDGIYIEYYENGVIKLKGKYKKGLKNGTWKYYKPDGEFDTKEKYIDGELKKKNLLERIFGSEDEE